MKASRDNIFERFMEEQQHHGLAERRVAAQAEVWPRSMTRTGMRRG